MNFDIFLSVGNFILFDPSLNKGIYKFKLDEERFSNLFLIHLIEQFGTESGYTSKESNLKKGVRKIQERYNHIHGKSITKWRIKILYKDIRFLKGYKLCCPYEIDLLLTVLVELSAEINKEIYTNLLKMSFKNYLKLNCSEIFIPKHIHFLDKYYLTAFQSSEKKDERKEILEEILTKLKKYRDYECFK